MAAAKSRVQFYPEVYMGEKEWHWRLIGKNGRIIVASSEGFNSKANAKRNFELTCRVLASNDFVTLN